MSSLRWKSFRSHEGNSSNIYNGLIYRWEISTSASFPDPHVSVYEVFEVTASVTDNDPTKTNTGQSFVDGDMIKWTGKDWLLLGNAEQLGGGIIGPTGATGPNVYVDVDAPPIPPAVTGQLWWDYDDDGGDAYPESYETISKNLKGKPYVIVYSGNNISTITYDLGNGLSVVKTFNYVNGNLTAIVLSGDIPSGITTTKTFSYTNDNISNVNYS